MTRKIYLIRHGETDLNKKKCFYGSLDVSINDTGKQQAQKLKVDFKEINVATIFVSDMKRAKETAEIIFPKQTKIVKANLSEKGFGKWEGLNANQIEASYPKEWQKWLDEPFDYTPPEAEKFKEFRKRVLRVYREIIQTTTGDIAIVCHLGVIRTIVSEVKQLDFWSIHLAQDAWLELEIENNLK
ncbi:histidine phosphatase family protein [Vagococcus hydrophili]|uniref:Histidine phosphatase family protein n=1 Tax=Vagococcus hydrophili TaxID=2714947 RepID=A0A6G8AUI7_9ENTE|nr:histidine phosphatase family protein [Vagococcus hydrophili]QIL48666.1 histidine phosphatase family protein [Vagococcus hydrophili]